MSAAAKPDESIESPPPSESGASIALRTLEKRTRGLSLAGQIVECVDLLQSPECVVDELVRSVAEIRDAAGQSPPPHVELVSDADRLRDEGAFFYPSRELFVQGDSCSFTCLSTGVEFREQAAGRSRESREISLSEDVGNSIGKGAFGEDRREFGVVDVPGHLSRKPVSAFA